MSWQPPKYPPPPEALAGHAPYGVGSPQAQHPQAHHPQAQPQPQPVPHQQPQPAPGQQPQPVQYAAPAAGSGKAALIVASMALLAAIAALVVTVVSGGSETSSDLGRGLAAYDLSTPKAAMQARVDMSASGDVLAQIQVQQARFGEQAKEVARTLKIDREVTYKEHKLLFVSFTQEGKRKFQVESYKKFGDRWIWDFSFNLYDLDDRTLEDEIREWRDRTEGERAYLP